MNSIIMRRYKKGDERGIIDLRNNIFGSSRPTDLAKWQWEYLNNPQGISMIFIYEDKEKIVGHYALKPILIKYRNKSILSGSAEDAMMHKHYRGNLRFLNLVIKVLEFSHIDRIDLIWGFPNIVALLPQIRAGFNNIGNVFNLIKIVNIRIVLEKFIRSYIKSRFISKIVIYLCSLSFSVLNLFFNIGRSKSDENIIIRSISRFDKRVDTLWEKANGDYGITIVRSCEYLNWRFVENPFVISKIFIAEKKEKILGYIVLKTAILKNQYKVGIISDLLFDMKEKKVLNALLNNAIKYFKGEEVAHISLLIVKDGYNNKSFINTFRKKGFLFKSRSSISPFILKANEKKVDVNFVNDIKNWYITNAFHSGVEYS